MFNKVYSPYQFSLFRMLFGAYLLIHFASLIPYASELWSQAGILPNPSINPSYSFFPNVLYVFDQPYIVIGFVMVCTLLSLAFALGWYRPIVALLLWYGWACLFHRNNLISNPGIPFIGWLLLASAVIPRGEPWMVARVQNEHWSMPKPLIIAAWLIMSIAYSISGYDKLLSESWADGSAIHDLLNNPLARNSFLRHWFLELPDLVKQGMSYSILGVELLFLPLALIPYTRKWIWTAMVLMHLGILVLVDFADLTIGMLMIHFFTFDTDWIAPKRAKEKSIVFFDGVCGLCNQFVNMLVSEDRHQTLRYSPLQGATAKEHLTTALTTNVSTVVYAKDGKIYTESDAVIQIMRTMGGLWGLAIGLFVIPKFIRNTVYKFVAKNRIKWFGQSDSCRMPTKEERSLFLD